MGHTIKTFLRTTRYLVLDFTEVQDLEVGELVNDEEPVVRLGHDGVMKK